MIFYINYYIKNAVQRHIDHNRRVTAFFYLMNRQKFYFPRLKIKIMYKIMRISVIKG